MNLLEYLHLQMGLEGNKIVHDSLIRQVETVPGEGVPLILIAQLATGDTVTYYDENISTQLRKDLAASISAIEFPRVDALIDVLKENNIRFESGHYKTYLFPSNLLRDSDVICFSGQHPKVKDFGFDGFAEEVYGLERDHRIVSACVSTRENTTCGEAWVFTLPEYRHQGFAQKVVLAWASSLRGAGKIAFYSHKLENIESANLAKRLWLQPVFEEISIAPIS